MLYIWEVCYMRNINVYDFDGTIYDGDSSIDFFIFCLSKNLKCLKYIPMIIFNTILYIFKFLSTKEY